MRIGEIELAGKEEGCLESPGGRGSDVAGGTERNGGKEGGMSLSNGVERALG